MRKLFLFLFPVIFVIALSGISLFVQRIYKVDKEGEKKRLSAFGPPIEEPRQLFDALSCWKAKHGSHEAESHYDNSVGAALGSQAYGPPLPALAKVLGEKKAPSLDGAFTFQFDITVPR